MNKITATYTTGEIETINDIPSEIISLECAGWHVALNLEHGVVMTRSMILTDPQTCVIIEE